MKINLDDLDLEVKEGFRETSDQIRNRIEERRRIQHRNAIAMWFSAISSITILSILTWFLV